MFPQPNHSQKSFESLKDHEATKWKVDAHSFIQHCRIVGTATIRVIFMSYSVELELQNLEFKILEGQNPEFKILDCQNPEFKILAVQNPAEFKILAVQSLEFRILAVQNLEFSR